MQAGRRIPPTHFLKMSCGKSETCGQFLGLLLCVHFGNLSQAPLIESQKLRPSGGWSPHPFGTYLDPLPGPFDWVQHSRCVVCESFMVAGPVDGAAPDLGVTLLAAVEHCQSFSLLGTVVWGFIVGHVAEGVSKS